MQATEHVLEFYRRLRRKYAPNHSIRPATPGDEAALDALGEDFKGAQENGAILARPVREEERLRDSLVTDEAKEDFYLFLIGYRARHPENRKLTSNCRAPPTKLMSNSGRRVSNDTILELFFGPSQITLYLARDPPNTAPCDIAKHGSN